MHIVSFINHKGGVGKTTVSAHIGYALAHTHQQRVLLLDFDAQANLSELYNVADDAPTIADVVNGSMPLDQATIHISDTLHLVPSSIDLADVEYDLGLTGNRAALSDILQALAPSVYDVVLIDCPPSLSLLTVNALMASTDVCIVSNAEYLALRGLRNMLRVIQQVQQQNTRLGLSSVVVSHYDGRRRICTEVVEALRERFPQALLPQTIRNAVAVIDASAARTTVFQHKASADVVQDFQTLAEQFLERHS